MTQRQRGQQRVSDHHSEADHHQPRQVTAPRPGLAQQQQQAKAKHCGDGGACGGDEPGVQFKHRQAGGRQRAGEDHHTDEAIDPTAR
ncbi:hypothetical protein G6F65_014361 [Rhizopus arrhizus]|nr:hypothetical protein G6F65_014361 [Rhizopus arrhizus]